MAEREPRGQAQVEGTPGSVTARVSAVDGNGQSRAAAMLAEFHALVAHPETDLCWLRDTLHEEESKELSEALIELDVATNDTDLWIAQKHVAKELADVVYVAYGTAHGLGIYLDVALERVHESNMQKAGGPRRADGKMLKPPGWLAPDMSQSIGTPSASSLQVNQPGPPPATASAGGPGPTSSRQRGEREG